MSCVYALVEESSPEDYRYIGRTSERVYRRLGKHLYAAKTEDNYVHRWIRKVQAEGRKVTLVVLEDNLTFEESGLREIALIAKCKKEGYRLTNISLGGDGSLGHKGWKHTEEALAKMRGNKHCLGRKDSPETREKKRLSSLGNKSRTGKPHTEESKAKMVRAQQLRTENGWKHTEETRERLRVLARLREVNPETRAKMSASQKQRWERKKNA
jgi:hypothetical protein